MFGIFRIYRLKSCIYHLKTSKWSWVDFITIEKNTCQNVHGHYDYLGRRTEWFLE